MIRKLGMTVAMLALMMAPALANPGHAGHHDEDKNAVYGHPGDPAKADRTVTITATEVAYDVKDITVKSGEIVKFVLINQGQQDHEFTIGDDKTLVEHREMMTKMTPEQMEKMGHHHTNAVTTKPGETKTLVWQFGKPGAYEFACNYPGHSELGMQGTLTVQ